ncbi:hypothetical protein [Brucella sp. NBRC 12950]|uniref:hypothetical protein n=1 Tax=Brucella sp. NBRC 12950 TaxID=2994518 RepID=UPI0024A53A4F|nr:hypothetical protein [Brucella sp. NBRC 12950]GLU26673.1 hypothetical protein Brsp01_19060 [Brucella sp. NBRC 12950]
MANEQPAGYVCDGCGRLTRDLEHDVHKLKEGNFLSCCPERKMLPVYTRTAAPVEGLETVAFLNEAKELAFTAISRMRAAHISCLDLTMQAEKLVENIDTATRTRPQSEVVIAAEIRRERDLAAKQLSEVVDRMSDDYLALKAELDQAVSVIKDRSSEYEALEADNAALTARVKGLEKECNELDDECNKLVKTSNEAIGQRDNAMNLCAQMEEEKEALETQLAAAKKALARAAYGFDQVHKSLMGNGPKQASGEVTAFFLAETNAALEGQS